VECLIEVRRESQKIVVHLAGHLSEAQVPDLLAACAAPADSSRVVLVADELVSADAVGIDALLRIEQRGIELVGLPQYLRIELDGRERKPGP
jgi:hypothetical protein